MLSISGFKLLWVLETRFATVKCIYFGLAVEAEADEEQGGDNGEIFESDARAWVQQRAELHIELARLVAMAHSRRLIQLKAPTSEWTATRIAVTQSMCAALCA